MSKLDQELHKIYNSGYSGHVILALQALRDVYSDVRVSVGEYDTLELRNALIAVLGQAVDKLSKLSKLPTIGDKTPLND